MEKITILLENYGLKLDIEDPEDFEREFESSVKENAEKTLLFSSSNFDNLLNKLFGSLGFIEIESPQKFSQKMNLTRDGKIYPEWFLKTCFLSIYADNDCRMLMLSSYKLEYYLDEFKENAKEKDDFFGNFIEEYKLLNAFDSATANKALERKVKDEINEMIFLFANSKKQEKLREQIFEIMEDEYRERLKTFKETNTDL